MYEKGFKILFLPIRKHLNFFAMCNTIKNLSFAFLIFVLLFTTSCFNDIEPEIERTAATEQSELNQALENIEAEGYDVDTSELGIYYVVHELGEGPTVQEGDTCFMEYAGRLLDGSLFDASIDYYPGGIWEFVYKENPLIQGFEDGIALMNAGMEVDLIIPSEFGYGPTGYGIIKPYTTLVFSVIMHDVKPKTD